MTTDQNGQATFEVTNEVGTPATATVRASASVQFESGVVFLPVIQGKQKLVLAEPIEGGVVAQALGQWINPGCICAFKFKDLNLDANSIDEPALSGWSFRVYRNGVLLSTRTTAQNGLACFTGLQPGSYRLEEALLPLWLNTTPDPNSSHPGVEIQLAPNESYTVPFGNIQLPLVTISKYLDANADSQRNVDEPLLDGWVFQVYDHDTSTVRKVGVTQDGQCVFTDLPIGLYDIAEITQPGYYCTTELPITIEVSSDSNIQVAIGNAPYPPPTATATLYPTPTWIPTPVPTGPSQDELWISDIEGCTNDLTRVAISLGPISQPLEEFSLAVNYNTEALAFVVCDYDEQIPSGSSLNCSTPQEGSILIEGSLTTPLIEGTSGTLLELYFQVDCNTCENGYESIIEAVDLNFSPLVLTPYPGWFRFDCPPTPVDPVPLSYFVAELVIHFRTNNDNDRVLIYRLLDTDHPELGLLKGDRLDPSLVLLSPETDPVFNGQVVDLVTSKVFLGNDHLNDIVILAKTADFPDGLVLLYRNCNLDDLTNTMLQYKLADVVPANAALPFNEHRVTAEPKFVRAVNVDHDEWNRQEIVIFFDTTLDDGANIVEVVSYPNVAQSIHDFRFGWEGNPNYSVCIAQRGRLLDVIATNLDGFPTHSDPYHLDDFVLLLNPDDPQGYPINFLRSNKGETPGFLTVPALRMPSYQQPSGIAVGEFWRDPKQPPFSYPDLAIALPDGVIYRLNNRYNATVDRVGFTYKESIELPASINRLIAGNVYVPCDLNDLVITAVDYDSGCDPTDSLVRFTVTTWENRHRPVQDSLIFDQPSLEIEGQITLPDQTTDVLIVDGSVIYIGLQNPDSPTCYGEILFDSERPQRRIELEGPIVHAAFTQRVGGAAPPNSVRLE